MIVVLMLGSLLVGGLLACAAAAVDRLLRGAGRPRRYVWLAALLAVAVWTVVAPFRPAISESVVVGGIGVVGIESDVQHVRPVPPHTGVASALSGLLEGASALNPMNRLVVGAAASPSWLNVVLALAWGVTTSVLLLALVGSALHFRRAMRRWPVVAVDGIAAHMASETGPGVWGAWKPRIVIPRWILEASDEERAVVLNHEREHQRAHDPALLTVAAAVAACMPWNVPMWWVYSRLRLTIELDCDARVLRDGPSRAGYCEVLLGIADRCSVAPRSALVSASSHLKQRIIAMQRPQRRPSASTVVFSAALAGLSLVAACTADLPSSAEIEQLDVSSAEPLLESLNVGESREIVYSVDGEEVGPEAARALDPDEIDQIEVLRGVALDEPTRVRVTTKAGPERIDRNPSEVESALSISLPDEAYYLVDGRPATPEEAGNLDRDEIHSIEIRKGPAVAAVEVGPDYVAGTAVIAIVTKAFAESPQATTAEAVPSVSLPDEAYYLIDGLPAAKAEVGSLDRDEIQSIEVIRGRAAAAVAPELGPDYVSGVAVIRIVTKAFAESPQATAAGH